MRQAFLQQGNPATPMYKRPKSCRPSMRAELLVGKLDLDGLIGTFKLNSRCHRLVSRACARRLIGFIHKNIQSTNGGASPTASLRLSDPNNLVRFRATRCLAHIHMKPELVVPALVQSLGQARVPERETIAALVAFGAQAKPAVSNLLALVEGKNARIWREAAHALKQIDPETAAKAGVE